MTSDLRSGPGRRRRHRHGRAITAVLAVASLAGLLAAAGCTTVPTGSAPQTVQAIGGAPSTPVSAPEPGEPERTIVTDFLDANSVDPVKHSAARQYLTPTARNRWTDTTATIIADRRIGTFDVAKHTVTVTGRKVGTLDRYGIYTPTRDGTGHGVSGFSQTYTVGRADGENRVSALPNGLLLTEDQFRSYSQRVLYFFDVAEHYLVPDVRYSALTDATEIADWMLDQIVQGPNPNLTGVVSTDLPTGSQRISAQISAASTTVQIPGSRQFSADVRDRIAAQVGVTLNRAVKVAELMIMDRNKPVEIPAAGATRFTASSFAARLGPARPAQKVYYLRDGRMRNENGVPVTGPLGNGNLVFDSVAVAQPRTIGELTVAGVSGPTGGKRLQIGTQNGGMHPTQVPAGSLTRPAFAPGSAEVWIGAGPRLYRVTTTDARTSQTTLVQLPPIAGGGPLTAVRLSPDGSRIALVAKGANNRSALYVGAVVRSGSSVQVESPVQISPDGVDVGDVAWIDPLQLFVLASASGTDGAQVFRVYLDGYDWNLQAISGLPDPPDSITMADGAPGAWVSANGFVWAQNGLNWQSPVLTNGTQGDNPIYLG